MNNRDGVITVKILIIFASIFILFALLFDILLVSYGRNRIIRDQKYLLESNLSNYSTYLYRNYGLYGVLDTNLSTQISNTDSNMINFTDYIKELKGLHSFAEPSVLKVQILNFMKYRLPLNYMDKLLSKLEVINKSKSSNDVVDLKNIADEALSKLENHINNKTFFSDKINELDLSNLIKSLVNINETWNSLHIEYGKIETKYISSKNHLSEIKSEYRKLRIETPENEILLSKKKQQLDEADNDYKKRKKQFNDIKTNIDKLYLDVNEILSLIDTNIKYNKELISSVTLLETESTKTMLLINKALDLLAVTKDNVLNEIVEYVSDSLSSSKELIDKHLIRDKYYLEVDNFDDINADVNMSKQVNTIIYLTNNNIKYLDKIKDSIYFKNERDFRDELIDNTLNVNIDNLKKYFNKHFIVDIADKVFDDELSAYYDEHKNKKDRYDPKIETFKVINDELKTNRSKSGMASFWNVINFIGDASVKMYENVSINEYIISTFLSASSSSETDYNYFMKYEREHYFFKGEIEYILYGNKSEQLNVLKAGTSIFNIRVIMNALHIYTDKEKLSTSESIGVAVAGWTGLGAPIVSNIIRVVWSTSESILDMKSLIKGESVPFYKVYPNQWKSDLGMHVAEAKEIPAMKLIELTYHDYLRIMLLTLDETEKLNRINDLIVINLYESGKVFELNRYYTSIESVISARIDIKFIDLDEFRNIKNVLEMSY